MTIPSSRQQQLQENEEDAYPVTEDSFDDEPLVEHRADPLIGLGEVLEGLSTKQERFLVAKLHGVSDKRAAQAAGITQQTAAVWKRTANFKRAYEAVINRPVELAADMTAFALAKAMKRLSDMLDDNRIVVRQYAIDTIIRVTGADNKTKKVEVKHEYSREDVERFQREVSGS